MPERGFDTGFWTKPFVQNLSPHGKLLLAYLKTSVHCNQAGVYTITPSTIAFETGLPITEIPSLLESLEPEVVWYSEENIVWVKPFFEEQAKSSKFIASALSIITRNRLPEDLPEDFQEYNSRVLSKITSDYPIGLTKRECVAIRDKFTCQYCQKVIKLPADYEMDHIMPKTRGGKTNYLNLVTSCRTCNQKKIDKTPDEVGFITPRPRAFHAAQAVFLLKNSPGLKRGWLQLFPERESVADSILKNVEQHYSIPSTSVQDTPLSKAYSNAKANAKAFSEKGLGVVKGEGDIETTGKRAFGELKNVMLTPEEHEKLVVRFGAQGATSWIDELSLAKASKGYKSKSDYATILAWERRASKRTGGIEGEAGKGVPHERERGPGVRERGGDIEPGLGGFDVVESGPDSEAGGAGVPDLPP